MHRLMGFGVFRVVFSLRKKGGCRLPLKCVLLVLVYLTLTLLTALQDE